MILAASPNSRAAWRYGLVEWSTSPEFTHALHLAPNRHDISFHNLTRLFSRFCLEVDRYMLGTKHVHLRNSHDRLHMIAMPEKLETNPHLHGFADFSEAQWGDRLTLLPWEWKLDRIWHRVPLPLPPLALQERIAAKINELFNEIDDGEEEIRRVRQELETYRKSLLKAAVTGELTADWRAQNPATESRRQSLGTAGGTRYGRSRARRWRGITKKCWLPGCSMS